MFVLLYVLLFISVWLFIVMVPKNKKKPILYCFKRIKPIKKQFLFSKSLIFGEYSINFYAELNGNFYIILSPKARVEFKVNLGGAMQFFNANQHFIRGNYSQNSNAYYIINKVHSFYSYVQRFTIHIKDCAYRWDNTKNTLILKYNNKKYYIVFNQKFAFVSNKPNYLECVNVANLDINYKSFSFKDIPPKEQQKFKEEHFGFYNTSAWKNKKDYYYKFLNKNTLQKAYFNKLLSNHKAVTNLYEINDDNYLNTLLNNYFISLKSQHIKINLFELGFGAVLDLKVYKMYLVIKDMNTNYKVYLKFTKQIKSAFLGCRFGELYLYITLKGFCNLEVLPFNLGFDTNIFIKNPIKTAVLPPSFNLALLQNSIKNLSINDVINKINGLIILGVDVDINKLLSGLYLNNLPQYTKFLVGNLILSKSVVFNIPLTKDAQLFVLNNLKSAKEYKKVELYCYLSKLITLIKQPTLQDFLLQVLNIKQHFLLYNYEYLITHYLGVKVINNTVTLCNPKIKYKIELYINNKLITLLTGKQNVKLINNINYNGLNYLPLIGDFKQAVIMCSIK